MSKLDVALAAVVEMKKSNRTLRDELTERKSERLCAVIERLAELDGSYDFEDDKVIFKLPYRGGSIFMQVRGRGKPLKFGRTLRDVSEVNFSNDSCELPAPPLQATVVTNAITLLKELRDTKGLSSITDDLGFKQLDTIFTAVTKKDQIDERK